LQSLFSFPYRTPCSPSSEGASYLHTALSQRRGIMHIACPSPTAGFVFPALTPGVDLSSHASAQTRSHAWVPRKCSMQQHHHTISYISNTDPFPVAAIARHAGIVDARERHSGWLSTRKFRVRCVCLSLNDSQRTYCQHLHPQFGIPRRIAALFFRDNCASGRDRCPA
jgi:hypothetical protein